MSVDLTPELEAAIRRGYAARDRDNLAPTIAYFERLYAEHSDNAVVLFELAGAYDTAGKENDAKLRYERALRMGLHGDARRRCLIQYASTSRWLGELASSRHVLEQARSEFPESEEVLGANALGGGRNRRGSG